MVTQALTRRKFLGSVSKGGLILGTAGLSFSSPTWLSLLLGHRDTCLFADELDRLAQDAPRARYWISTESVGRNCLTCHAPDEVAGIKSHFHSETVIKCLLCAQGCLIQTGERGRCRTRINVDGELRSLVYGHPISVHVDPIEKKPFYHFLPGSEAFSLATAGCPLHCKFCQNWELSQMNPEDYSTPFTPPEDIVAAAESNRAPVIAYTYNEPTVFTEYLTDIARCGKPKQIRSVLVSCGFMNEAPLREMCEVLDAIKIDLKGFSEDFYHKVCSAELKPVLSSIKQVAKSGKHLEIVNLVVPTLNDSKKMLEELAKWVVGEVGQDVPVHFTRFHPDYQLLNLSPTPVATLEHAREIAMEQGIHYAFVGNVPGHPGNHTYCPQCGKIVIKRTGFFVEEMHLKDGCCSYCNEAIAGIWK